MPIIESISGAAAGVARMPATIVNDREQKGLLLTVAALFFGVGDQTWPVAHAALVAIVSQRRTRDAGFDGGLATITCWR
ncbi:hypothetical protein [Actinomadura sp. NEAU-AAG7]|uniref:hypothetical protein n=1 Tax=Actinomadura sp. NEAU-AAG7 TaxID=2839640 RepID=UPI001BE4CB72|nr:hypothetical protein [Actinomadura sp. NEAU-AAG7]MBT2208096.1 hypothetical protein [Actinomadura sp. NEAU-AAG7]